MNFEMTDTTRTAEIAAFARNLANSSAEQLTDERWQPADFLDGDFEALVEAFGEMTDEETRAAWKAYQL